jgi:colanic acid/amylovoran biosynthesis glycosyltransferase
MKSNAIMFCAYDSSHVAGGPLVWIQRLLPDLAKRGFDIHPILLHWDSASSCVVQHVLRDTGLPVRCLKLDKHVTIPQRVRWLIDQAIELKPTVFVTNHVIPAYFAAPHLQRFGVKTAGVIHSDESFYEAIIERFYLSKRLPAPDAVVPVSALLEKELTEKLPPKTRITRIPCGCPTPAVNLEKHHQGRPLRIMYSGRIVQEQKRILDLADAFTAAAQQVPGTEYSIFGDGPEQRAVADKLAQSKVARVILHGPVHPDVMLQQMQQHDAFVLMSDYEGLPIALVEAMACGLVPICYDFGSGANEVIQDGVNGIIIKDRGPSFIAAIQQLNENPSLRQRLAANARITVDQEYSSSINHGRWADLLANLDKEAAPDLRLVRQPMRLQLPPIESRFRGEDWHVPSRTQALRRALLSNLCHFGRRIQPKKRLRRAWQKLRT